MMLLLLPPEQLVTATALNLIGNKREKSNKGINSLSQCLAWKNRMRSDQRASQGDLGRLKEIRQDRQAKKVQAVIDAKSPPGLTSRASSKSLRAE